MNGREIGTQVLFPMCRGGIVNEMHAVPEDHILTIQRLVVDEFIQLNMRRMGESRHAVVDLRSAIMQSPDVRHSEGVSGRGAIHRHP